MYACATFGLLVSFPWVFRSSRVTGAGPVTTNLIIMRVNVRTTTSTILDQNGDGRGGDQRLHPT